MSTNISCTKKKKDIGIKHNRSIIVRRDVLYFGEHLRLLGLGFLGLIEQLLSLILLGLVEAFLLLKTLLESRLFKLDLFLMEFMYQSLQVEVSLARGHVLKPLKFQQACG